MSTAPAPAKAGNQTRRAAMKKGGGAAQQYLAGARLVEITVAEPEAKLVFTLRKDKLRQVRRRKGRYLLRTNLTGYHPAPGMPTPTPAQAGGAPRPQKRPLSVAAIYQPREERIEPTSCPLPPPSRNAPRGQPATLRPRAPGPKRPAKIQKPKGESISPPIHRRATDHPPSPHPTQSAITIPPPATNQKPPPQPPPASAPAGKPPAPPPLSPDFRAPRSPNQRSAPIKWLREVNSDNNGRLCSGRINPFLETRMSGKLSPWLKSQNSAVTFAPVLRPRSKIGG